MTPPESIYTIFIVMYKRLPIERFTQDLTTQRSHVYSIISRNIFECKLSRSGHIFEVTKAYKYLWVMTAAAVTCLKYHKQTYYCRVNDRVAVTYW